MNIAGDDHWAPSHTRQRCRRAAFWRRSDVGLMKSMAHNGGVWEEAERALEKLVMTLKMVMLSLSEECVQNNKIGDNSMGGEVGPNSPPPPRGQNFTVHMDQRKMGAREIDIAARGGGHF